ncbi:hypothetical protein RF11_03558 [Thelohanellus kitauei]|uniref:Uncharacterized protein n=1 Tax=Thelohanellus kitauei TaxID=669202 RepID=A0A0C2MYP9_THEKT|nr:hypothetical protein RF11_03558 [Thelohanellus kitauei]
MKKRTPYQHTFKKEWEQIFPITKVDNDPYSFYCVPCAQKYSCRGRGIGNVRVHCETLIHKQNALVQTSGSSYAEPGSDVSSDSAEGTSLRESTSEDIILKTNLVRRNKSESLAFGKKEPEMFEAANKNHKESNVVDNESEVTECFEKYKYVYKLDDNVDMYSDLHSLMSDNFDQILDHIKEESLCLGYVLTMLEKYKQNL